MRKFLITFLVVMSFLQAQTPVIRLMQSRDYKSPKFWWRDQVTHSLRTYLADDTSTPAAANWSSVSWANCSLASGTIALSEFEQTGNGPQASKLGAQLAALVSPARCVHWASARRTSTGPGRYLPSQAAEAP